ncbi:substrate-binding domain-containing protein [Candidatus Puniceispirillum sp.]|nr:substrate-binding domain-containing protein [Candidatus Puniceispirillum sp.]
MAILKLTIITIFGLTAFANAGIAETAILVQSTTSTKNSGLYNHILPIFKHDTGITVNVVAVGTGAAIKNAMNCDGDVLLVHSRKRENNFVAKGYAKRRYDLMYNDYVIVGPVKDPANIVGMNDAVAALKKIANTNSKFASRGDSSGTDSKEKSLWESTGVNQIAHSGHWYRETGSGMGTTLNTAVGMGAYTLSDRASWRTHANKADFKIMVEGDKRLFNPYGVMLIDKTRCPNVNSIAGKAFIDWLISEKGQTTIAAHRFAGKQLFFPNTK